MKPGIYRGQSAGCFGLWRLTPEGRWLFSMPVEGDKWRDSTIGQDAADLAGLVLIAADDDTGPLVVPASAITDEKEAS